VSAVTAEILTMFILHMLCALQLLKYAVVQKILDDNSVLKKFFFTVLKIINYVLFDAN